jgi:hypothetical protein
MRTLKSGLAALWLDLVPTIGVTLASAIAGALAAVMPLPIEPLADARCSGGDAMVTGW